MTLAIRRVLPPMGELGNVYSVRRNGVFIGYAARWRRWWLAGRPDGFGTWHVSNENIPILHRRREDAVLRLAMAAEGLLYAVGARDPEGGAA